VGMAKRPVTLTSIVAGHISLPTTPTSYQG
jgi:hypothetical protein